MLLGGYRGKILRVNLSTTQVVSEDLLPDTAKTYVGGRGFGARYMCDEISKGIDPFSPNNEIMIFAGPLTGSVMPSAGKTFIFTKSPLTGIYLSSAASGFFGNEMKYAGWDGIIIEGKADQPCVLVVNDGKVDVRPAGSAWGMNTDDAQSFLREMLGDSGYRMACIGPAGEHLVRFAAVMMDKRSAGRGGAGAVMGSKNLKAIAIRGTDRNIPIYNPEEAASVFKKIAKISSTSDSAKVFQEFGSGSVLEKINDEGLLPTRNYQQGVFEGVPEVSPSRLRDEFVVQNRYRSCPRCGVRCSRLSLVRSGKYAGTLSEGPEYETLWVFGPQLGNSHLDLVLYAEAQCDRWGLDTMSTGSVIGFAMECFEKGLIDSKDTEGLDLRFGNNDAIAELIRQIAFREGFGDILANGTLRAAQQIGKAAERLVMHVKGMDMSGYDPRGSKATALMYCVASRGACHHNLGYAIAVEVIGNEVDRFTEDGKAALVKRLAQGQILCDTVPYCIFARYGLDPTVFVDALNAVTGLGMEYDEVPEFAQRILTLERLFSCREGISRKDDILPERFLKEPLKAGRSAGQIVNLDKMLDEYYSIMGWDNEGIPTPKVLQKLGLNREVVNR